MKAGQNIAINSQGSSQITRFSQALDPGHFGVDERKMGDLLAFSLEFTKHIRYKNLKGEWHGDWSVFYANNLAFLIGSISSFDIDGHSKLFNQERQLLESTDKSGEKLEILSDLFDKTLELFTTVNRWYRNSKTDILHLDQNVLVKQLQNAIDPKLKSDFQGFRKIHARADQSLLNGKVKRLKFDEMDPIWRANDALTVDVEKLEVETLVKDLSVIHKSISGIINYVKSLAPSLLPQILENYPFHAPQASLFLSFIKLFEHVQGDLNKLNQRHLDYYFKDLLKQKAFEARPDHAHVYMEPADNVFKSLVPKGTVLTAGVDEEGYELTYETEHDLELSQAKISDLRIVHVARNPVIGLGGRYRSVSNIYSREVEPDTSGFILDSSGNSSTFEIMGRDQSDLNEENRDMAVAQMGFAVTSPILVMNEGERKLVLDFYFELKSLGSLVSFIEELTQREQLSPDTAFYKILNNIFKVRISGDRGWFETDRYEILPPESWTNGNIKIQLLFDVSDPAIVPYDPDLHGEDYSAKWPVLEFTLSSNYAMYGYSYLKDLIVQRCEIDVEVQNIKSLEVHNDLGQLDASKPFYPFGSTPDIGSYLLVGHDELCLKKLEDVSLDFRWHNLPRDRRGLGEYYDAYEEEVNNSSFKVKLSALSEFQFNPSKQEIRQELSLFQSIEDGERLSEYQSFKEIELDKLELKPTYELDNVSDFDNKSRAGFIRMEISAPSMGFGHADYQNLFSETVVANSASPGLLGKEKEKKNLPREPLALQLRSVSMNYKASAKLFMNPDEVSQNDRNSGERILHLHPFGKIEAFENGLPKGKMHLLPQYNEEGYLYIGLEGLSTPQELSIYFELRANLQNVVNFNSVPNTKWSYLVGNHWKDFEENEVIFDGTNNFSTSGIVRLSIPTELDREHEVLPSRKFWICVSAPDSTDVLSKVVFVRTNAVRLQWTPHREGAQWEHNLPAESINGFSVTQAGVNSVTQPFPSFGGKEPEGEREFYTRVAERLKHKNRAVLPEDYEKMVLAKFPELFQAKCLNNTSHPNEVEAGVTKLIVVPKVNADGDFYLPRVDYHKLGMIEEYLRQRVSPFVQLEIVNPIFEKVKISCEVKFRSERQQGEFIKNLKSDLRSYICPWFDQEQKEMDFGGSVERDDILTFIESLPYIEFVTKLSVVVLHFKEGKYSISDSAAADENNNHLTSSSPWSVLVPDEEHEIGILDKSHHELPQETRIETMRIGSDFVIDEEEDEDGDFPYFDLDKDTYYKVEIDLD